MTPIQAATLLALLAAAPPAQVPPALEAAGSMAADAHPSVAEHCFAIPSGLRIVFHGNEVLADEIYLAFLKLPAEAAADAATAALVRRQLTDLLRQTGYQLAVVNVAVKDGALHVIIDEGVIGKLILRGQAGLETVEARVLLEMPKKVFNRRALERGIRQLQEQFGLFVDSWELVPSAEVPHLGPQLENLWVLDEVGEFFGQRLIPANGRFDLQVFLHHDEWKRGIGVGAGLDGSDGMLGNIDYRGGDLILERDRWIGRAELGAKLRGRLATEDPYLAITRGLAELGWRSPALALTLRPSLDLRARYSSHQRPDLPLESYRMLRMQGQFSLRAEPKNGIELWVGGGMERLIIWDLVQSGEVPFPPGVAALGLTHPVVSGGVDFVFDKDSLRIDRRHELHLEALHYPAWAGVTYGVTRWQYQKVFELGWHDFWVTSSGRFLWGETPFVEENSVGSYVRGVFPDTFYSRRAGGLSLEYRFSLVRDIYKLALFHDAGLYEVPERGRGIVNARFIDSFGLGLSALIADAFQLDVYYALGFSGRDDFDHGVSVSLRQAF